MNPGFVTNPLVGAHGHIQPGGLGVGHSAEYHSRNGCRSSCAIWYRKNTCRSLLKQMTSLAFCFARDNAGSNSAARMPTMAITTSNSIKVNPCLEPRYEGGAMVVMV